MKVDYHHSASVTVRVPLRHVGLMWSGKQTGLGSSLCSKLHLPLGRFTQTSSSFVTNTEFSSDVTCLLENNNELQLGSFFQSIGKC